MAQIHLPRIPHFEWWNIFTRRYVPVLKLFFVYAVPLSLLPPVMIHYAGVTYGENLFKVTEVQLQIICIVLFIAELIMTFLIAYITQRMSTVAHIKSAFADAYNLAVVVPMPLWLASLALFIPSLILIATVAIVAMIISGLLIFYNAPVMLKIEEVEHAMLLSGCILAVGMVAWALIMYLTLLTWSYVTSTLSLLG